MLVNARKCRFAFAAAVGNGSSRRVRFRSKIFLIRVPFNAAWYRRVSP